MPVNDAVSDSLSFDPNISSSIGYFGNDNVLLTGSGHTPFPGIATPVT